MDDRTLLELAAKAAGLKLYWHAGKSYMRPEMEFMDSWNPLTDDGDALRLAVELNLLQSALLNPAIAREALGNGDWYAATRRTIVCAAAEIGRK